MLKQRLKAFFFGSKAYQVIVSAAFGIGDWYIDCRTSDGLLALVFFAFPLEQKKIIASFGKWGVCSVLYLMIVQQTGVFPDFLLYHFDKPILGTEKISVLGISFLGKINRSAYR